jgi:hypothetical protein
VDEEPGSWARATPHDVLFVIANKLTTSANFDLPPVDGAALLSSRTVAIHERTGADLS